MSNVPPVKSTLNGMRATFREGQDNLILQNNVEGKLFICVNGQGITVDTNQFLGALNHILSYKSKEGETE